MAKYSEIDVLLRDVIPVTNDELFPRILDRAARMAYDYINTRLSSAYPVPFTAPYPSPIVSISDLLTKCIAISLQNRKSPVFGKNIKRDAIHDECSLAVSWLDDLANTSAILPGVAVSGGAEAIRADTHTIFDVDDSTAHMPSSSLLDQIDNERD